MLDDGEWAIEPRSTDPFERSTRRSAASTLTSLVGRSREIAAVSTLLLREDVRLVVLTGPGGIGKTRLALEAAEQIQSQFAAGATVVNLSPVRDRQGFIPAVARALGVRQFGARVLRDVLLDFLRQRRCLLVLDNFEQILPAARELGELLAESPNVTALVTSRAPLQLSGEHLYPLSPLSYELSRSQGELSDSARLFCERARATKPDFTPTAENRVFVDEICQKLNGIPLAIELAAARLRHFTLEELCSRLDHPLPHLTTGNSDHPDRLQTMRNAIGWSYELLSDDEQASFRRLSVFPGGFRLDAAMSLTGSSDENETLTVLSGLIDNSLLRLTPESDGASRYSMLEVIREFGLEQLQAAGEFETVNQQMAEWCEDLLMRGREILGQRRNEIPWIIRYDREIDNFRTALAWFERTQQADRMVRMTSGLGWYWYGRNLFSEGRNWFDRSRTLPGYDTVPQLDACLAEFWHGLLAHYQDDEEKATRLLHESQGKAEAIDFKWGQAATWFILGMIDEDNGAFPSAERKLRRALQLLREDDRDDRANDSIMRYHVGIVQYGLGDPDEAISVIRQAYEDQREIDDRWGMSSSVTALGLFTAMQNRIDEAVGYLREGIRLRLEVGTAHGSGEMMISLAGIALCAIRGGRPDVGVRIFAMENRVRQSIGNRRKLPERQFFEMAEQEARQLLDAQRFDEAWAIGNKMRIDDAIQLALTLEFCPDAANAVRPDAAMMEQLTSRELEVLQLVSEGLTNPEIAGSLFISRGTVRIHVSNILGKLGASTRTEAVRIAQRNGLISTT
jgi:predicted ATPase/DNA-binding CsgD family transcriptional regulator